MSASLTIPYTYASNPIVLHKEDSDGILHAKEFDFPYKLFVDDDDDIPVTVCNYCDGLICFIIPGHDRILIWNPSLPTEYKIIPSLSISRYELAAMGYDRSSDDYKIVKFPSSRLIDEDYSSVAIFSLKNNSWSNKIISKRNSVSYYAPWLIYAKNGIHWIATQCYEEDEDIECIMYFDLAEESLDYMNSPSKRLICLVLMNYKESIAILGENFEGQHELWVLENYCGMKSSWNKISSFNFSAHLFSNYSFTLNGEILVHKVECWFSRYNAGKCRFSKYDAKDGSLKSVVLEDDKITYDAECSYSFFGSPYVESLVALRQL